MKKHLLLFCAGIGLSCGAFAAPFEPLLFSDRHPLAAYPITHVSSLTPLALPLETGYSITAHGALGTLRTPADADGRRTTLQRVKSAELALPAFSFLYNDAQSRLFVGFSGETRWANGSITGNWELPAGYAFRATPLDRGAIFLNTLELVANNNMVVGLDGWRVFTSFPAEWGATSISGQLRWNARQKSLTAGVVGLWEWRQFSVVAATGIKGRLRSKTSELATIPSALMRNVFALSLPEPVAPQALSTLFPQGGSYLSFLNTTISGYWKAPLTEKLNTVWGMGCGTLRSDDGDEQATSPLSFAAWLSCSIQY